jgi:hypothetical protein
MNMKIDMDMEIDLDMDSCTGTEMDINTDIDGHGHILVKKRTIWWNFPNCYLETYHRAVDTSYSKYGADPNLTNAITEF